MLFRMTRLARSLQTISVAAACAFSAHAQQKHLYIANDDHTDFMWSADEATYERVFQEMIDFHLALTEQTKDKPAPFQNRFNLDGSYWLRVYEKKRTPEEFARVIAALKSGHLSAPMNALVSCYGAQPAEAVLRGMSYAGQLERKYGLRFTQAVAMENRTLPLGLPSLWAGSGARYSWRGICKSASRIALSPRDHEICWLAGPDGQRVLMKWHSWVGVYDMGGYGEAFDPRKAVERLDSDPEFLRRYRAPGASAPYDVRGAFGFGWDALDRKTGQPYLPLPKEYPQTDHFHQIAEQTTTAERQVFVSNQEDFFKDFEAKYGSQLPTESAATGNQWDLYSATMAETSSRVRRAVEKLRAAEALAAVVATQRPDFLHGREAARDQAFIGLGLYWEHDWTTDGAVTREARAAWQEKLAAEIEGYVNTLHADAQAALGGLIQGGATFLSPSGQRPATDGAAKAAPGGLIQGGATFLSPSGQRPATDGAANAAPGGLIQGGATFLSPSGQRPATDGAANAAPGDKNVAAPWTFYVFNPLGWTRTDAADFLYTGPDDIHVRDLAADADVPHQFEKRGGKSFLRILARDIPSVGYKVFAILPGPGTASREPAATVSEWRNRNFENSRVKLTLETDGAIDGFFDKAHPDYNLAGRIDGLVLNDFSETRPYRNAHFEVEHSGPVSVTLVCTNDAGRNHTTRITLLRDSDRVEIRNEITEGLGDLKHWAFSFNLDAPDVHTEEVGAIIRAKTKPDGGDYATKNARYDYATLNHFADITDGKNTRGVTLSNSDCSFVKLGHSTPGYLDTATAQLNVLAGGQVDGEGFGIRNQNGATYFLHRFALRAHAGYDPVAAMKFSVESQNPPVTGAVSGGAGSPYPAKTFSLVQVSNPDILLWALKPADDGIASGIIARAWNLTAAPADATLTLAIPGKSPASVQPVTHIETDTDAEPARDGPLTTRFAPQQLRTFRLKFKSSNR